MSHHQSCLPTGRTALTVLLICFLTLFTLAMSARAAVPGVIAYQGRLDDASGSPVADGTYNLTFTIYDAASGGSNLWTSGQRPVPVSDGLFTYALGSNTPFPSGLFDQDTLRWLGVQVDSDPELTPRTRLTSQAYAFHSSTSHLAYGLHLLPTDSGGPCGSGTAGVVYYDSIRGEPCYCNGTEWVQVDGGGSCLCVDADGDGYDVCDPSDPRDTDGQFADCDDNNSSINPGQSELCDGIDNDCDGTIDNGSPGAGASCNTGQPGVCAAGITVCQNGVLVCVATSSPTPEVCDGLDNDCDGAVDEGNPGGGGTCNTGQPGVCASGTLVCQNGALTCVANTSPSAEVCDGLDNDCDGVVDNGNPGGGGACNTGLAGICSAGTLVCQSGALTCVANTSPTAEVCDGLDNDCDGTVDEGNPGGGGACNTGQPGICANGTLTCVNGALACQPNFFPSAEVCDGLDNDCDGAIDEGNPGGGSTCNTGLLGVCAAGTVTCSNGALTCVQNVQPSTEVCGDGLDNDCDGTVDEGCP